MWLKRNKKVFGGGKASLPSLRIKVNVSGEDHYKGATQAQNKENWTHPNNGKKSLESYALLE